VVGSARSSRSCRLLAAAGVISVAALIAAVPAFAAAPLIQISSDPYTNPDSQHKTQVEPDTFAWGSTIVAVFQSGRYFNGGASNIGWATSTDQGQTWQHGFLPGTTDKATPPGTIYKRASDASIAYDAKHNVWITSYLGLIEAPSGTPSEPQTTPRPPGAEEAEGNIADVDVLVSRSTDGGLTWGNPILVNPAATQGKAFLDKNWTACDDSPSSRFYGNCYTEFDNNSENDLMQMSTSTDGGLTWGAPKPTADPCNIYTTPGSPCGAHGIGGQPVVQPDGRVVVPYVWLDNPFFAFVIGSFVSVDGGNSWSATALVSEADFHEPAGNLRAGIPLPSAETDASGKVYVTWSDCRFQAQCRASDLVLSTSTDGIFWSRVRRIPLDPVGRGVDHFLPGLAVDRNSRGADAHLGLVYYYYPDANCTVPTCQLDVGFASSRNGGRSWSPHEQLAGPMTLTWLPLTTQGYMVGDYFSTSIPPGKNVAVPVFQVAHPPSGGLLDQPTYAVREDIAGPSGRAPSLEAPAPNPRVPGPAPAVPGPGGAVAPGEIAVQDEAPVASTRAASPRTAHDFRPHTTR
jgi:BNR repeat-like domain